MGKMLYEGPIRKQLFWRASVTLRKKGCGERKRKIHPADLWLVLVRSPVGLPFSSSVFCRGQKMGQSQCQQWCAKQDLYNAPLKILETIHLLQMKNYFLPPNFRGKFRNPNHQMRAWFKEYLQRGICPDSHVNRDLLLNVWNVSDLCGPFTRSRARCSYKLAAGQIQQKIIHN